MLFIVQRCSFCYPTCRWLCLIRSEVLSGLIASFVLFISMHEPGCFDLSNCARSAFHRSASSALICCTTSRIEFLTLCMRILWLLFVFLLLLFAVCCHHTLRQSCVRKELKFYLFYKSATMRCTCTNKEGLASICMHPHAAFFSVSLLSLFYFASDTNSVCSCP